MPPQLIRLDQAETRRRVALFFVALIGASLSFSFGDLRSSRSAELESRSGLTIINGLPPPSQKSNSQALPGRSFIPTAIQTNVAGITQISLAAKDILYDPARQLIYATVSSNAADYANNVVPINPSTGEIGVSLTTGDNPGRLGLSDDSRYLYVGLDGTSTVRRLDLQSQTPDFQFPLGVGSAGSPNHALDIKVVPGEPQLVAVSLRDSNFSHQGVAIFDNGVQRPNKTGQGPPNDLLEFGASSSTLFGLNTSTSQFGFHRLALDANGVTLVTILPNVLGGNEADMKFDNGLMYGSNGRVIDPETSALVGAFQLPGFGYAVAPDSVSKRVYFISSADTDFSPRLWAFDLETFLPIGSLSIPGISGWPRDLIRCGSNCLALRTSENQIFLIQPSAIQPINPAPLPSPTVGENSVIKLQLATNDLVFDPGTQKVYASIPGTVAGLGNSIAPVDPTSGEFGQPIFIGPGPTKLAVSSNNQYLYAGLDGVSAVRQFNLHSQSAGLQFPLGFTPFGPLYVNDMEVQPGNASVVAISLKNKLLDPNFEGVAVYDNGIKRPNVTQSHTGSNVIEFGGSPAVLYGLDTATTNSGLEKLSVDDSGVSVLNKIGNLIFQATDFKFDNGLIYASNGQVCDPEAGVLIGAFPIRGLIATNSSVGRVYFLSWSPLSPSVTIYAFDSSTFLPLSFLTIPNVSGRPGSFIRWGTDGLAFRTTGNEIYFLRASNLHAFPNDSATFTTRPDGIREFSLSANDLIYNPADQLIYASVPSVAGTIGNSIAAINAATGLVGQPVFIGSEPYKLALSNTDNALYATLLGAPRVQKFDLATKTPSVQFGLGSDPNLGPFYGQDLAVSPANSDVVAVSTYLLPIFGGSGIVLTNNGLVLPDKADGNSLAFSGSHLYTYMNDTSLFGLSKLAITPTGLSQVDVNTNLINGFFERITAANGRIFGSDGAVVDDESLTLAGKFIRTDPGSFVIPEPANKRVYFLGLHEFENTSLKITAYDSQTFIQVGSLTIPNVISSDFTVKSFIRYGVDGLAFATGDGKIYFLTTSMITPLSPTQVPSPMQLTPEIKLLTLSAGDLVYNPSDGLIYASLPSRVHGNGPPISFGNSIVPINPITATLGPAVRAGSEPKKLVSTSTGQFLFAALDGEGAVCRMDVESKTISAKFSLGNDVPSKGPRYVEDMKVAPGSVGTLAISRRHKNGSPRHLSVAIYDNGIQRPDTTAKTFPTSFDSKNLIEYGGSPSTIYAYNLEEVTRDFHELTVTTSGVQVASSVQNLFEASDIKFDNGLLFSTSGQVINPETLSVVGAYTNVTFFRQLVIPESATNTVYFLTDELNGTATIRVYDMSSFTLRGTISVPGIKGDIASFIRWGTNGLAFRTTTTSIFPGQGNQVFIIQLPASLTPAPTPTPSPMPTPTPGPLQLLLELSGPSLDQVAVLDSSLFLRDPFPIINGANLLNQGSDRNTRVIVFVRNLVLAPGDGPSVVVANMIDSNNKSHDVPAEDARAVPNSDFHQVIFRLPDTLAPGAATIKIKVHSQVSNAGTIRIRN